MKPYLPEHIETTRDYFERQRYPREKATIQGITFPYFVLPRYRLPNFPDFVLTMAATPVNEGFLLGISDRIEAPFRPYWMYHEVLELIELPPDTSDRCLRALELELQAVPRELRANYVPQRREFFANQIKYAQNFPDRYTPDDFSQWEKSGQFLEQL